jgi:capsular polysaccharide biosynthesis protein
MNYLRIVFAHWIAILFITTAAAALTVGLSFIPTQMYSSEVSLLIVQKQAQYVDPYTSQKAAEKLGQNLVNVIDSFDFLNRVLATGTVSPDLFSASTDARKKQWEAMTDAEMFSNTGVLHITAYAPTAGAAEDVVMAMSTVLTTNSSDYHGGGDTVEIKLIDGPVTSDSPVKPNIPLNGAIAAVLGLIASAAVFIVYEETKRLQDEQAKVRYVQTVTPGRDVPPARLYDDRIEKSDQIIEPQYKVLDEYPKQPYVYGAELKDEEPRQGAGEPRQGAGEPVSMQDLLKK